MNEKEKKALKVRIVEVVHWMFDLYCEKIYGDNEDHCC